MDKILIGPAGRYEIGKNVLNSGADEVFLGLTNWSLRSPCFEMTYEDILRLHHYAENCNKRLRVCLNTYPWEHDLKSFDWEIERLVSSGIHSLVLSDVANIAYTRKKYPDIDIQASVACDIRNIDDVKVLEDVGASSVTLSPATTDFINLIKSTTNLDVVIFAHGYLNFTYRARCYMSSYLRHTYISGSSDRTLASGSFNREGHCNRACKCNWSLESNNDLNHGVTMNSYPFSVFNHLGDLLKAGADALKIQGRENSDSLVLEAIGFYRQILDRYMADPESFQIPPEFAEKAHEIDTRRQKEMRDRTKEMICEMLDRDNKANDMYRSYE